MRSAPSGADTRRAAFTLLELLAVLGLIAILAGIVIGAGRRATESGRVARTRSEIAALAAALEAYRQAYGSYPQVAPDSSVGDTASGRRLFSALTGWRGPALDSPALTQPHGAFVAAARFSLGSPGAPGPGANYFVDPWGNPYHYAFLGGASGWRNPSYALLSAGPDGRAALPIPDDGIISPAFASARQDGAPVNADNVYANR
ncbi:MAG TPA: prepilin-type N-terminal cleavage/methylation domain-containing protein [Lacunisphaera sp.]|nr:prepilin-type N-terminal cleavage/methylation domain-containing protein [Lacunisphaera sp.]